MEKITLIIKLLFEKVVPCLIFFYKIYLVKKSSRTNYIYYKYITLKCLYLHILQIITLHLFLLV